MSNNDVSRRRVLGVIAGALGGLWTAGVAALTGVFVTTPLRRAQSANEAVLAELDTLNDQYKPIRVEVTRQDGWREDTESRLVFARLKEDGAPQVFSATCTHLGCTVDWEPENNIFQCPCHDGKFRPDGTVLTGPPPEALHEVPTETRDGKVFVRFA